LSSSSYDVATAPDLSRFDIWKMMSTPTLVSGPPTSWQSLTNRQNSWEDMVTVLTPTALAAA